MFGGVFTVAHGYWWHWTYLDDRIRFVSLLLAMAVLVIVAVHLLPRDRQHRRA